MAHPWKIKCDCGHHLLEKETEIEHIPIVAMVCPHCGFTTLTKEQAKDFQKLVQLHQALDQERQVIKIGNSMGITLPDKLREFGVSVGKKVRLEAIDGHSFKVKVL